MRKVSQATLINSFCPNSINTLIAPIGAGKNFYFGGKFLSDISTNKCVVFLAPLCSIVEQAQKSGRMDSLDEDKLALLQNFTLFKEGENIDKLFLKNSKIAMTAQKFSVLLIKHPEILENIGAIVVDEFDSILSTFANRDRGLGKKYGLHKLVDAIPKIVAKKIFLVLTSATYSENIVKQLQNFSIPINPICFEEELFQLKPKFIRYFQKEKEIIIDNPLNGKTAIFAKRVVTLVKFKEKFEEEGYKVALLKSKHGSNEKYIMNSYDLKVLKEIETNSKVPEDLDILLYNQAFERGVSIEGKQFSRVWIWDSNEIVQKQASGRFRRDGMEYFYKGKPRKKEKEKEKTELTPDEQTIAQLFGKHLLKEHKERLAQQLNWKNSDRTTMKWRGIKAELLKRGYTIEEKHGRKGRIHIIHSGRWKDRKYNE